VKKQSTTLTLMSMNLILMGVMFAKVRPTQADAEPLVIRARTVELVDARGRVRSRLNVEPDGTVAFRLFDQTGAIRVKLAAAEDGSGLMLADEATEPGVHLVARRSGTREKPATTGLVLTGPGGQQRVLRP
jgi:hypothetical protein